MARQPVLMTITVLFGTEQIDLKKKNETARGGCRNKLTFEAVTKNGRRKIKLSILTWRRGKPNCPFQTRQYATHTHTEKYTNNHHNKRGKSKRRGGVASIYGIQLAAELQREREKEAIMFYDLQSVSYTSVCVFLARTHTQTQTLNFFRPIIGFSARKTDRYRSARNNSNSFQFLCPSKNKKWKSSW